MRPIEMMRLLPPPIQEDIHRYAAALIGRALAATETIEEVQETGLVPLNILREELDEDISLPLPLAIELMALQVMRRHVRIYQVPSPDKRKEDRRKKKPEEPSKDSN